jgi:hypothetical protein
MSRLVYPWYTRVYQVHMGWERSTKMKKENEKDDQNYILVPTLTCCVMIDDGIPGILVYQCSFFLKRGKKRKKLQLSTRLVPGRGVWNGIRFFFPDAFPNSSKNKRNFEIFFFFIRQIRQSSAWDASGGLKKTFWKN